MAMIAAVSLTSPRRSFRPQVLPDLLRQLIEHRFAQVQLSGQTLDQGLGGRRMGIALAHQLVHRHLQLLGEIDTGAGMLVAGGADVGGELVARRLVRGSR